MGISLVGVHVFSVSNLTLRNFKVGTPAPLPASLNKKCRTGVSPVIGFSWCRVVRLGQGELESSPRRRTLHQEIRAEKIKKQARRLFYIIINATKMVAFRK